MTASRFLAAACALACFSCPVAWAQDAAASQAPAKPAPQSTAQAVKTAVRDAPDDSATGSGGEPKVQHTVIEDDATRIEELKVRGQTQRITVQPKGMKAYEIIPADQGRDMSESAGSQRGAAGKRVWRIITF